MPVKKYFSALSGVLAFLRVISDYHVSQKESMTISTTISIAMEKLISCF